jgi:hypothetical protein
LFARDLHIGLAVASVVAFAVVALEAAGRVFTGHPAGRFAGTTSTVAIILVGMTAAGGLALLVSGERPSESLHFVYAVLAFVVLALRNSLTESAESRRRAIGTLVAAAIALAVVARLFATG